MGSYLTLPLEVMLAGGTSLSACVGTGHSLSAWELSFHSLSCGGILRFDGGAHVLWRG